MEPKQETLLLAGTCLLLALLSLAGLAWTLLTGLIFDIDGLMMAMVCLAMAGIFSLQAFLIARREGWLPALGFARGKAAARPAGAAAASPVPDGAERSEPSARESP